MQVTHSEVKNLVSGIRRELKSLKEAPTALSHNQWLELLARAAGHSTWAAWAATLPKEPASKPESVETSRYPLLNTDGRFDLVNRGEEGTLVTALGFRVIEGTLEQVQGCAAYAYGWREPDGSLHIDYAGDTWMYWDSQEPVRDAEGNLQWLDARANQHDSHQLVLAPEEFDKSRIRTELLGEYESYFRSQPPGSVVGQALRQGHVRDAYAAAEPVLGFSLTERELKRLCFALADPKR